MELKGLVFSGFIGSLVGQRVPRGIMMATTLSIFICIGCDRGAEASVNSTKEVTAPTITTTAALNGAVIVSLTTTTSGATIHYTVDGSLPTTASQAYQAPFLVASNMTVNAIATTFDSQSNVASQAFAPNVTPGTLVWSDEFTNSTSANAQPNPQVWTYATGPGSAWNAGSLDIYCGWNSAASSCDNSNPNAYVGIDGYLHIVADQPSTGIYTSAQVMTQGLFSFMYGRIEFRAQVPEAQGFWPAFWLMGNNKATVSWPACGEVDVLERINVAKSPDFNMGSIHIPSATDTDAQYSTQYNFPSGQTAAGWHTYGMIWKPGSVALYVDNPTNPYATYASSTTINNVGYNGVTGATWPFDEGPSFIILDLAVGGTWPGPPNSSTPFPSQMLVDYVRIYTN